MRNGTLSHRLHRLLSPTYGARQNAAAALDALAARGEDLVLHGSDLALLSGHPAGLSLRRAAGRLGTALWESFPGHVALLDRTGTVVSVNRAWRQFSLNAGGSVTAGLGTNYLQVCEDSAAAGCADAAAAAELVRPALAGVAAGRPLVYEVEDDRWFSMLVVPLAGGAGALVVHTDATAFRESEGQWRHRALHDPLTGLPNRALLADRLEHATVAAARDPRSLAVLFVDVDSFKRVNDEHGHAAGDQVLREVAARMTGSLRSGDTLGRWGGDEFLVIAERLEDSASAAELADRIVGSCAQPIDTPKGPLTVGLSVGLAHFDQNDTPEDLVEAADRALQNLRDRTRHPQLAGAR